MNVLVTGGAGYIGSHTVRRLLELGHRVTVLDAARRASGAPVPAVPAERRAGDPPAVWADATRARNVLGWTAVRGLDEIVGSAYRWHASEESKPKSESAADADTSRAPGALP